MYPLELIESNPAQFLTPYLPLIGVVAGAVVVGLFNAHNRRKGNVETRAPDVNELWQQERALSLELDTERKKRLRTENLAVEVIRTFRAYVQRVLSGGSPELTHHELKIHDTRVLDYTSDIPIAEERN